MAHLADLPAEAGSPEAGEELGAARAGTYRLLAALLAAPPGPDLLSHLAACLGPSEEAAVSLPVSGRHGAPPASSPGGGDPDPGLPHAPDTNPSASVRSSDFAHPHHPATGSQARLAAAWRALGTAAARAVQADPATLDDEYHALFIGVGRGEVVPYASWYHTGFLMDRPLAELRTSLAELGLERSGDVSEPEDHAAAVLEAMSLLVESGQEARAAGFFSRHVGQWLPAFFTDLGGAPSAGFYGAVAELGLSFLELEQVVLEVPARGDGSPST